MIEEMKWSGTVLLIDDEESMRKIAKNILARMGFSVIEGV